MTYFAKRTFASIDPYYVLGVDRRMEYDEIKKHYYKLASQYHPDKNPSPVSTIFLYTKNLFLRMQKNYS